MSGEPCEECRKEQIRIGAAAAVVGAGLTGAVMYWVLKVRN
jgi:hypothetical protein